jgi:hypothetical protein
MQARRTDTKGQVIRYAHIRVDRFALQQLRYAIASQGGTFHGSLQREASAALERHAVLLMKKVKAKIGED